jgi:hypothetical protein
VGVEQVIEIIEQTRCYRDTVLATNLLRRAALKPWWVGRSGESQELLATAAGRSALEYKRDSKEV